MKYFIAALSTVALSFAFAGTASAHPWYPKKVVYRPAPICVPAPVPTVIVAPPVIAAPAVVPAPVVEVYRPPVYFYRGHGHFHR